MRAILFTVLVFNLTLAAALFMPTISQVHAQAESEGAAQDASQDKPMPEIELMPEEDFINSSSLFEEVPYGIEALSYSMRLPKRWSADSINTQHAQYGGFAVRDNVLTEFARYYGPPRYGDRNQISMKVANIPFQMSAEQWFRSFVLENGHPIYGIDVSDENNVNALYVHVRNGLTYIIRANIKVSGKMVIVTEYQIPDDAWNDEKAIAERVIQSLVFKNKSEGFVEEMLPYEFLDIAKIRYPKSWTLKAPPLRSADQMSIELLNLQTDISDDERQILNGKIDVYLVSDFVFEDIPTETEYLKDRLSKSIVFEEGKVKPLTVGEHDDQFLPRESHIYHAYNAEHDSIKYEFFVTVFTDGGYYYFITLLTPSSENNRKQWVRNTQTYDLVIKTLEPLGGGE